MKISTIIPIPMSVANHLQALHLYNGAFTNCRSLSDEFSVIKRAYFKNALLTHPDKGGDSHEFRNIDGSFKILRDMFQKKLVTTFGTNQKPKATPKTKSKATPKATPKTKPKPAPKATPKTKPKPAPKSTPKTTWNCPNCSKVYKKKKNGHLSLWALKHQINCI